jgi:hypothetical protein
LFAKTKMARALILLVFACAVVCASPSPSLPTGGAVLCRGGSACVIGFAANSSREARAVLAERVGATLLLLPPSHRATLAALGAAFVPGVCPATSTPDERCVFVSGWGQVHRPIRMCSHMCPPTHAHSRSSPCSLLAPATYVAADGRAAAVLPPSSFTESMALYSGSGWPGVVEGPGEDAFVAAPLLLPPSPAHLTFEVRAGLERTVLPYRVGAAFAIILSDVTPGRSPEPVLPRFFLAAVLRPGTGGAPQRWTGAALVFVGRAANETEVGVLQCRTGAPCVRVGDVRRIGAGLLGSGDDDGLHSSTSSTLLLLLRLRVNRTHIGLAGAVNAHLDESALTWGGLDLGALLQPSLAVDGVRLVNTSSVAPLLRVVVDENTPPLCPDPAASSVVWGTLQSLPAVNERVTVAVSFRFISRDSLGRSCVPHSLSFLSWLGSWLAPARTTTSANSTIDSAVGNITLCAATGSAGDACGLLYVVGAPPDGPLTDPVGLAAPGGRVYPFPVQPTVLAANASAFAHVTWGVWTSKQLLCEAVQRSLPLGVGGSVTARADEPLVLFLAFPPMAEAPLMAAALRFDDGGAVEARVLGLSSTCDGRAVVLVACDGPTLTGAATVVLAAASGAVPRMDGPRVHVAPGQAAASMSLLAPVGRALLVDRCDDLGPSVVAGTGPVPLASLLLRDRYGNVASAGSLVVDGQLLGVPETCQPSVSLDVGANASVLTLVATSLTCSGDFLLRVTAGGEEAPCSPLAVRVEAAGPNAAASSASLSTSAVTTGVPVVLALDVRDSFGNAVPAPLVPVRPPPPSSSSTSIALTTSVTVRVSLPSNCSADGLLSFMALQGRWGVLLTSRCPGLHAAHVEIGGLPVLLVPATRRISPPSSSSSSCADSGGAAVSPESWLVCSGWPALLGGPRTLALSTLDSNASSTGVRLPLQPSPPPARSLGCPGRGSRSPCNACNPPSAVRSLLAALPGRQ